MEVSSLKWYASTVWRPSLHFCFLCGPVTRWRGRVKVVERCGLFGVGWSGTLSARCADPRQRSDGATNLKCANAVQLGVCNLLCILCRCSMLKSIRILTAFCLVASWGTVATFPSDEAGFAGLRIGRTCFYNGICSRAIGASVLSYPLGSGVDVYFQPRGKMVENEATYLGGNHTFGFGRHLEWTRMWFCLPLWAVGSCWAIQFGFGFRRDWICLGGGAALAVLGLWLLPMRALTVLTWATGLLFLAWIVMGMRSLRQHLNKSQEM